MPKQTSTSTDIDVKSALALLEQHSSRKIRDGYPRYGIHAPKAFGVPMNKIQLVAKRIGRNQPLAEALWRSGWYEARLLASYVADPERVTPALMDRWCRDFDNWGVVDTVCFCLFDRTPHAFKKIAQWSKRREEFEKRAAFVLIACVALHDKESGDAPFVKCLSLIERAATDDRNFVKKGVNWALRAVGTRSVGLNARAIAVAGRLARSTDATARWVGKDAVRALENPKLQARLARRKI